VSSTHPREADVYEREIEVQTQDGVITTFVAHPDGTGPFPVAVLYQDGIGYREQIKENVRRFAADGYYCVAPDLFYRHGPKLSFDPMRMRSDDDYRAELFRVIGSIDPEAVIADTDAVLAAVADDPAAAPGPKVCVGYCMGARLALHAAAARSGEFVAAACIHPGVLMTGEPDSPHHDLGRVRGELLVAFAEVDQSVTGEMVDEFRRELEARDVDGVVERWPGTHGFAMADLPVYDRDASERHFERTLELWRRNLSRERVGA
jgi:carboxymethylenebutenolidase